MSNSDPWDPDGIDVAAVIRRAGSRTGLIVDLLDTGTRGRYLEDLPPSVLLTEADIAASAHVLAAATAVSVQLQQPAATALAAARVGRAAGRLVVLDGAPGESSLMAGLLACADVVRADAAEAELLAGQAVPDVATALRVGRSLLDRGPRLVALAVADGDVFVWPGGESTVPLADVPVVDTTGAGDAFTAALTLTLVRGGSPQDAAREATAAAAATVGHAGGRPSLSRDDTTVASRAGGHLGSISATASAETSRTPDPPGRGRPSRRT